jgi:hypothetical protein
MEYYKFGVELRNGNKSIIETVVIENSNNENDREELVLRTLEAWVWDQINCSVEVIED